MFVVEKGVGRVIQARVHSLADGDEVERYRLAFLPLIQKVAPAVPVLFADHRPVRIYTQPVSDAITRMFESLNIHWVRVAILVSPSNATLAMQLTRIVRESNNPSRQVFFETDRALTFLGEVLQPDEISGLRAFATATLK